MANKYELDIYNGDGVQGEQRDAGTNKRLAIQAARQIAKARWHNVGVVRPSDDDVISFGPLGDGYGTDQYVTVRRISERHGMWRARPKGRGR